MPMKTSHYQACSAELGGLGLWGLGRDKKLEFGADPVPYLDTHCDSKRSL